MNADCGNGGGSGGDGRECGVMTMAAVTKMDLATNASHKLGLTKT
jgi:hypothetical protein